MEFLCCIEPQVNPLFPIAEPIDKNICLKVIWLPNHIAKEFKIYLITVRIVGLHLQYCIAKKGKREPSFISNYTEQKGDEENICLHKRPQLCLQNGLVLVLFSCQFVQTKTSPSKQNQNLEQTQESRAKLREMKIEILHKFNVFIYFSRSYLNLCQASSFLFGRQKKY